MKSFTTSLLIMMTFLLYFSGTPTDVIEGECFTTYENTLTTRTIPGEKKVSSLMDPLMWICLKSKIVDRCRWSGEKPEWWLTIIYLESGRSFKHDTVNWLGYQGAIQLGRPTHEFINKSCGMRTPFEKVKELQIYHQIEYMFCYVDLISISAAKNGRFLDSFEDLYLCWFYPKAAITGKYAFAAPGSAAAKCNPGFVQKFGRWAGYLTRGKVLHKLNSFKDEIL